MIHQYAPVDGPAAVGRFLDRWRPDLGLFVESELYFNRPGLYGNEEGDYPDTARR